MIKGMPAFCSTRTKCKRLFFLLMLVCFGQMLKAQVYTINAAQPTAGNNFQSFAEALIDISGGISQPVVLTMSN
jgi:hypothetical protein